MFYERNNCGRFGGYVEKGYDDEERYQTNGNRWYGRGGNSITNFLSTLSPGINVMLQYDDQQPAFGTFQGFEYGNVILTDYNGFSGLVRIAVDRVNAVSPVEFG